MKRKTLFLLSIFIFFFLGKASAQINENYPKQFSREKFDEQMDYYLNKREIQNKYASMLLGGGLVVNIIGITVADNHPGADEVLSSIGGFATAASILLFSAASKNKNKAQMVYFQKNIAMAASDSLKKLYLGNAVEYFNAKARGNTTAAIVLSILGGGLIVVGVASFNQFDNIEGIFSDLLLTPLFILSGISLGLISIPFYVKGTHFKRTANMILRTGRIPNPGIGSIAPFVRTGRYVAIGIKIQL